MPRCFFDIYMLSAFLPAALLTAMLKHLSVDSYQADTLEN